MRIWDVQPGYLNRQSLLGEHRELHGLVSILINGKQGYSRHPETLRWVDRGWALRQRHRLLAAEMALRGYRDQSPVELATPSVGDWPATFIDPPARQFELLQEKYRDKEDGRIPLPRSAQQLWAQHKYSVMARDVALYQTLGKDVAQSRPAGEFSMLALQLVETLRRAPSTGGIRNALQHMWGYVSNEAGANSASVGAWSLERLLQEVQQRSRERQERYLLASTALSELAAWMPEA